MTQGREAGTEGQKEVREAGGAGTEEKAAEEVRARRVVCWVAGTGARVNSGVGLVGPMGKEMVAARMAAVAVEREQVGEVKAKVTAVTGLVAVAMVADQMERMVVEEAEETRAIAAAKWARVGTGEHLLAGTAEVAGTAVEGVAMGLEAEVMAWEAEATAREAEAREQEVAPWAAVEVAMA